MPLPPASCWHGFDQRWSRGEKSHLPGGGAREVVGLGRWWGLGGGGPDSWVVCAWEESLLAYPVINVE